MRLDSNVESESRNNIYLNIIEISNKLKQTYGDLQLLPDVDHLPQLEVPYPITNGGQQFRRASGSCPVHSVTFILKLSNVHNNY